MTSFMVVATFRPDTDMSEVFAVVAEEQARVAELKAEGRLGAIHLATEARQTVFLEVIAETQDDAVATVMSLPMATWWTLDVYPLNAPAVPQGAPAVPQAAPAGQAQ